MSAGRRAARFTRSSSGSLPPEVRRATPVREFPQRRFPRRVVPPSSPSVFSPADAPPSPRSASGGGYKGFCDYEEIKQAIKECDGLDGARLEACYAEFGCDVDRVTEHYAKAAGIDPKTKRK